MTDHAQDVESELVNGWRPVIDITSRALRSGIYRKLERDLPTLTLFKVV